MAVKKLKMMNVVCENQKLDEILKDIILDGKCQFADAVTEIEDSDFYIALTEENADEILNMEDIGPIKPNNQIQEYMDIIINISEGLDYKPVIRREYMKGKHDFFEIVRETIDLNDKFTDLTSRIHQTEKILEKLENMRYLDTVNYLDINLKSLKSLDNFTAKFGYLSKEKRKKIARNYENIFAVVLHVGTYEDKELYIIVSPKKLDLEMERILKSTDFYEIEIDEKYLDSPEKALEKINNDKKTYKEKLEELRQKSSLYLSEYSEKIDMIYSKLKMEEKINELKQKIAATEKFSYFSAWFPSGREKKYDKIFNNYGNVLVTYKEEKEVSDKISVPTLLVNSKFFRPFEKLVNMYGIPSNNEADPTFFFGLIYIIIFGAMFGDLGQGLVFVLTGLILSRRGKKDFGDLMTRVGIGSAFFGIIYDSFFGYEHIISKYIKLNIFVRPMENINTILLTAISVGVVLLILSYLFSIYNKLKAGNFGKGIFGKNGLNGMILFLLILMSVYKAATGNSPVPGNLINIMMLVSVGVLIFEEPLGSIIEKKEKLFEESKAEYFTESGFNILETFLAIISNSISFIRVGAFALNHVGLFIAFHIMADMIGTTGGNIAMFLLGNIIIIGLEGLIVFIQGLRLFYYELFSKFYRGEGILFCPDKI